MARRTCTRVVDLDAGYLGMKNTGVTYNFVFGFLHVNLLFFISLRSNWNVKVYSRVEGPVVFNLFTLLSCYKTFLNVLKRLVRKIILFAISLVL